MSVKKAEQIEMEEAQRKRMLEEDYTDSRPDDKPARDTWNRKLDFIITCIGYNIGLSNVWRFPFLCYKHGGGAFLLPYLVMVVVGGLPMYFLELAIGQYYKAGCLGLWGKFPAFKGVGIATMMITFWNNVHYPFVMAWALWYLFHSFQKVLPWSTCGHPWNTYDCVDLSEETSLRCSNVSDVDCDVGNSSLGGNFSRGVSSVAEFWVHNTLRRSSGIEDVGQVHWKIALTYLLVFTVIYLCIWKGIKWSAKIVYVTALVPYVLIIVLLVRGATLPGAIDGIRLYLSPQFHRLADSQVWIDATSQVFYSTGVGYGVVVIMGSYNHFHNNMYRSAIFVATVNSLTSLLVGFAVFSILGFLAYSLGEDVSEVTSSGPGLVFKVYPAALAQLSLAPFWSCLFFLMIFLVGIDSQFCTSEAFFASIFDEFGPALRKRREVFIGIACVLSFLVGLPMATEGGIYVFNLLEWYAGSRISLFTVVCFESAVFGWFYGGDGFYGPVSRMIGYKPNRFWLICWRFVIPAICVGVTIFSIVKYSPVTYEGVAYPVWAEVVGWFMTLSSIVWIPVVIIMSLVRAKGSFRQRLESAFTSTNDNEDTENPVFC